MASLYKGVIVIFSHSAVRSGSSRCCCLINSCGVLQVCSVRGCWSGEAVGGIGVSLLFSDWSSVRTKAHPLVAYFDI